MILNVKRINGQDYELIYGSEGAACFDLVSNENTIWEKVIENPDDEYSVYGDELLCFTATISTGYCFEVPEGFRMDIYPRSGWGFKYNIQLANGTGKIDSDYRGEIIVKLIAFSGLKDLPDITKGTRIAQAEINKVNTAEFKYVETLNETERGENGFGSTGTKS